MRMTAFQTMAMKRIESSEDCSVFSDHREANVDPGLVSALHVDDLEPGSLQRCSRRSPNDLPPGIESPRVCPC